MTMEEIIVMVDTAPQLSIRNATEGELYWIYDYYVLDTHTTVEFPCTPKTFQDFWRSLTEIEKKHFVHKALA